jgi:hypothetical protein
VVLRFLVRECYSHILSTNHHRLLVALLRLSVVSRDFIGFIHLGRWVHLAQAGLAIGNGEDQ